MNCGEWWRPCRAASSLRWSTSSSNTRSRSVSLGPFIYLYFKINSCVLHHYRLNPPSLRFEPWPDTTSDRRLERVLAESQNHHQQLHEQLSQQLSNALSSALSIRVDKVLREELKKTVPQSKPTNTHIRGGVKMNRNEMQKRFPHREMLTNTEEQNHQTVVPLSFSLQQSVGLNLLETASLFYFKTTLTTLL